MRLTAALALSSIAFTFFVFSPAEVYYSNPFEFQFVAADFLPSTLFFAGGVTLIGSVLFSASLGRMPKSTQYRLIAVLVSIGIAVWVQGTFVVWSFGALDGRTIRWQDHDLHAWDLLIWIFVLVLPQVIIGLRSSTVLRGLCVVVLFTQGSSLAIHVATSSEFKAFKLYRVDASKRFEFSTERNVILVILDEFQCDIFDELLQRDLSLPESFNGFTYFSNTLAPAQQTFPSVPTMLTGVFYDNSMSVPTYLQKTFLDYSLFKKLTDSGVRTEVYPYTADTVLLAPEIISNTVLNSARMRQFLLLLDVGFFRSLPFILKRHVYRDGQWLISSGLGLPALGTETLTSGEMRSFRDGLKTATARAKGTTFKFNHLAGMHVPLRYDENLDAASGHYSREMYTKQAVGVLGVMQSLLRKLHELNIYDRSLIIIAGDHGSGRSQDMWIRPSDPKQEAFNKEKARACPLLLVKPFALRQNSHPAPLQISAAPVTLVDIPATILAELGVDEPGRVTETHYIESKEPSVGAYLGQPLFSVSETDSRPRRYDSYPWKQFKPLYLPPITEYVVDGDVRDDRSWRKGRTFLPPK
jgi:hypothetical protein